MSRARFSLLAGFAAVLALAVVMLGAYVRLSDAGLGCPDWPGCYGRVGAPHSEQAIEQANAAYPHRPVETHKAWKEMVHRYLAGTLGLMVLALAALSWLNRRRLGIGVKLPTLALALVVFQALLGMWTVTLLVNPTIVTSHLIGGMSTMALLWWISLREGRRPSAPVKSPMLALRPWALGALLLLAGQIFLGGWTSTNYAALACVEFPTCHGDLWWPDTDFAEGFTLWRELGVNYEFGVLDSEARTAIHLTHRIGALVVLLYVGALALSLLRRGGSRAQRSLGGAMGLVLLTQIVLGITNVLAHLPLPVAVAHNGGAAMLLLCLLALLHILYPKTSPNRGLEGRSDG